MTTQPTKKGSKHPSFKQYLNKLGLDRKRMRPLTPEEEKEIESKAIEDANKIIKLDTYRPR